MVPALLSTLGLEIHMGQRMIVDLPIAGQTPLPGASLAEGIGLPVTGFAPSPQDTEDLLDLIGDPLSS